MKVTRMLWYAGTVLTAFALLAVSTNSAAQERREGTPAPDARHRERADSSRAERDEGASAKSFRAMGLAAKLHTTPEALAGAYARARQANPRLNRGQFIAAHVVAANLGDRRPNVTTQALLAGLQRGQSIGQTLQSLGLSASEAKAATRTADRERKDSEQRVRADNDGERRRVADLESFRKSGIAAKLHTTPEVLLAEYRRAQQANPRLTRGQFIAANVVAANLHGERPNVTTQALLSGLQNGRSIGQTLRTLGLSAAETKAATRTADRHRKEAEQRVAAERRAANEKAKRNEHEIGRAHV